MQSSTSKLKFYDNSTLRVLGERTLQMLQSQSEFQDYTRDTKAIVVRYHL